MRAFPAEAVLLSFRKTAQKPVAARLKRLYNFFEDKKAAQRGIMLKTKRVYEKPEAGDGLRVLVDRLWPRGLTKEKAGVDLWLKDIAPSHGLRKWSHHDPARWDEFKMRYFAELASKGALVDEIKSRAGKSTVTLLFAARDAGRNNAVALLEYLKRRR